MSTSFSPQRLLDRVRAGPVASRYSVACSGGLDSSVLLHALAGLRERLPAPLRALHINHGLHPDASDWEQRCAELAAGLDVGYVSREVSVDPGAPAGLEAAARAARRAAFADLMQPGEVLLTAHHADDQLETVLLQILRGAGPRGLAAMPQQARFAAGWMLRPLLDIARAELVRYARFHGLEYVDDPSNTDRQRDRNYLRHEVVPWLKQRWPAAATTAGRVARHMAEAGELLAALARQDLAELTAPNSAALPVAELLALGRPRAANVLRYWLVQRGLPLPNAARLETLLEQMVAAADRSPEVAWPGAETHVWRGHLYALPARVASAALPVDWDGGRPLPLGSGLGALRVVRGGRLNESVFRRGVTVRWRAGGEQLRPAGSAHHRALKDWLREAGIPPWMRSYIPLLVAGEDLVAVADLWIAAEFAVASDAAGVRVEWQDGPALIAAHTRGVMS